MIIRNARLGTDGRGSGDGLFDIFIYGEKIKSVRPAVPDPSSAGSGSKERVLDVCGKIVVPGMIDPHVHLRCPGTEAKEDWVSGSLAAAAGGVTTLIDMPNTLPATDSFEALALKREAAALADSGGFPVRRLFWAGCRPGRIGVLAELLAEDDVAGVKIFFSESSTNDSCSDIEFITSVFRAAAAAGKPAAVHSELAALIRAEEIGPDAPAAGLSDLARHNLHRPEGAAVAGTALALELAAVTGCRLYLCHLSTLAEFAMVEKHKEAYGSDSVTAELTPHHLLLDNTHTVNGGPQSWAKVNPPLRTASDRAAARHALLNGTIDLIGSDHAPHRPEEKNPERRSFDDCPSGFPGLETSLGLTAGFIMDSHAAGGLALLQRLTSGRAAEIFGLVDRGAVAEGMLADLVILGPPSAVDASAFKSKAKYSPFNGMKLPYSVNKTIIGGKIVEQ